MRFRVVGNDDTQFCSSLKMLHRTLRDDYRICLDVLDWIDVIQDLLDGDRVNLHSIPYDEDVLIRMEPAVADREEIITDFVLKEHERIGDLKAWYGWTDDKFMIHMFLHHGLAELENMMEQAQAEDEKEEAVE